jgi:hypothetical protein
VLFDQVAVLVVARRQEQAHVGVQHLLEFVVLFLYVFEDVLQQFEGCFQGGG